LRTELHPEADAEFAAQIEYYEDRERGLGERFYREVMERLDWIAANPTVPRVRKDHRRVNLKVFPFYIGYAIDGDLIRVLAIAPGRKRPGYWRKRLKHR
jgi:hypothetical protein